MFARRALALMGLLATSVGRSAPAPVGACTSPPAGRQAPPAPQAPQPTFTSRIELVTSDVIARDASGQFVADLKQEEFEIYEDDVLQDVASMVLVHGGRTYNQLLPPPPPPQEGIILPPTRPVNDAAGRIFLFIVDDLHMDFRNTGRIRDLFKKMAKEMVHEGDMFGVVSTGPSSLAVDLTYDRKRLDEAITHISGNGLRPTDIIEAPEGAEGPSELRYRAHVAFATAYDIMKNLSKISNRRKAVILVSNGYDFNPFPAARAFSEPGLGGTSGNATSYDPGMFQRQGQQFADADLVRELAELTRAANRANATIYTIDPRGLVGGPDLDENIDMVEWGDYIRQSQDSLRVLADLTGGIAVVNQNDFDRAIKRIDAETSDYYVLGFYSKNPDPLKRTRQIEIKVKREGVTVWYRKSYSLLPAA